jgi:hypothetical protein
MPEGRQFTTDEAREIGDRLGIDWDAVDLEQFRQGLAVEMEHADGDPATDITHGDPLLTGKIAWAHLNEYPDYYTRLAALEREAEEYWSKRRQR